MRDESLPTSLAQLGLAVFFGLMAYHAGATPFDERALRDTRIHASDPVGKRLSRPRESDLIRDPAAKTGVLFLVSLLAGGCSFMLLGSGAWNLAAYAFSPPDLQDEEKSGRPFVPVSPSLWRHRGLRLLLVSPTCPSPASARRTALAWSAFAVAYHVLGLSVLLLRDLPWFFAAAFALAGSMLLGAAIPRVRYYLADRKVDLEILDWTREARLGEEIRLRCRVTARSPLRLRSVRLTLACFEHTLARGRFRSRCLDMIDVPLTAPERLEKGEAREIEGVLSLPPEGPRSSRGLPTRVTWTLGVVVDLPRWPDLEDLREVRVRPA